MITSPLFFAIRQNKHGMASSYNIPWAAQNESNQKLKFSRFYNHLVKKK
jgi:hypothetical protein